MWQTNKLCEQLGIDVPILQAPMAGSSGAELAIAVANAGGLGSLPCAYVDPRKIETDVAAIRAGTNRPINLNFFCHEEPALDAKKQDNWRTRLQPYYDELGVEPPTPLTSVTNAAFDDGLCGLVEDLKPQIVSFHFGLPEPLLLSRVKAAGCVILGSATTVAEARALESGGADVIIAQGAEAGGHRGMFLSADISTQVGTMALVPQVVDSVDVPVVAAGGIADGRGIAAAFALGASGVQIGTAFLRCPEALTLPVHRAALDQANDDSSVLTNVLSGRPARGIVNRVIRELGPLNSDAPAFPLPTRELGPLRAVAQQKSDGSFSSLWSGQAAALAGSEPAADFVKRVFNDARRVLGDLIENE